MIDRFPLRAAFVLLLLTALGLAAMATAYFSAAAAREARAQVVTDLLRNGVFISDDMLAHFGLDTHPEVAAVKLPPPVNKACPVCPRPPWLDSDSVAVIVETRLEPRLLPTLLNYLSTVPEEWRVQIFGSPAVDEFVRKNEHLKHHVASGKLLLASLPEWYLRETSSGNAGSAPAFYSRLLGSEELWQNIAGEHVLIFQLDTKLCSNSPHSLNDFREFDYIGAPWSHRGAEQFGGNGGLSKRRRSAVLKLFAETPNRHVQWEDGWFTNEMYKRGMRVNTIAEGMEFSLEGMYGPRVIGLHAPYPQWLRGNWSELKRWCLEARMVDPNPAHATNRLTHCLKEAETQCIRTLYPHPCTNNECY